MTINSYERPAYAEEFILPNKLDAWVDLIVDHYAELGVPLPERRYWTIGMTAHDCEQMVIAVQQMFIGTAAAPMEIVQCNGPRGLTFTVEVVRCVPGPDNRGRSPSPDSIEASSVDPVIDLEILLDIAKYFDEFSSGVMVTADVIAADGGMHGALATFTVNL